ERQAAERAARVLAGREAWTLERRRAKRHRRVVPVTVVAGRLGVGKTTVIRRIVEAVRDFRLGVVVNDFAELNVDSLVIREDVLAQAREAAVGAANVTPQVVELSNGCVCCSLASGLEQAVRAMVADEQDPVDYVVVETSGVSNPVQMVHVIEQEIGGDVRLDSVVYVTDVDRWREDAHAAALMSADVVVLNKLDLVGDECAIAGIRDELQAATQAQVVGTRFGDVALERLLDVVKVEPEREAFGRLIQSAKQRVRLGAYALPQEGGRLLRRSAQAPGPVQHAADEEWRSVVFESDVPLSLQALQNRVLFEPSIRTSLARLKGTAWFRECPDERIELQHSGRGRISAKALGRWTVSKQVALALVVRGSAAHAAAVEDALAHACCATQPRAEADLAEILREDMNLEVVQATDRFTLARLVGRRSFGFSPDDLRRKFGVDLDAANEVFAASINASSHGLLALPVCRRAGGSDGSDQQLVLLARHVSDAVAAREAVRSACEATFAVSFTAVKHCRCD
ncbi:COBW domain-containing protein DDB_G0274527, partial [Durusdinium trenchii]